MTPTGVLVMAYGTADGPDDIERYYADIRGGRPPTPEHLRELEDRYAAIGNRFPLLDTTREQAEGIERELNVREPQAYRAYLGMKHSPPFIPDTVARMRADGIDRAVGIVMAPHWSGMSIETYIERVHDAVGGGPPAFTFVRSFHDDPAFVRFLAERVRRAIGEIPDGVRDSTTVVFSAHSLPVRALDDGTWRCKYCRADACATACRYDAALGETARLVAAEAAVEDWTTAWQSAGRTEDPWWGPPIEDVIAGLGSSGKKGVVVCSAGFVADHLEILYDLDIEARRLAEESGLAFARTEMPNAEAAFVSLLADVVRRTLDRDAGS